MTYRVEVFSAVSNYLRCLDGISREGRLAIYGFVEALRNYGDEARKECPRRTQTSSIFQLRWTFDAGTTVRTLDLYVDDSQAQAGLLQVLYAELVPLPDEE